jgi:hypothetical protein
MAIRARYVWLPIFNSGLDVCRWLPQDYGESSDAFRSHRTTQARRETMSERNFFSELKRRNVYKVAVAYIVGGWALAQGLAQVLPVFNVQNRVVQLLVVFIVLGLPVALGLAWAFELTPEGIKRTEQVDYDCSFSQEARLALCSDYRRAVLDWIIFSRSLHGYPYATRSGRGCGQIDCGSSV